MNRLPTQDERFHQSDSGTSEGIKNKISRLCKRFDIGANHFPHLFSEVPMNTKVTPGGLFLYTNKLKWWFSG